MSENSIKNLRKPAVLKLLETSESDNQRLEIEIQQLEIEKQQLESEKQQLIEEMDKKLEALIEKKIAEIDFSSKIKVPPVELKLESPVDPQHGELDLKQLEAINIIVKESVKEVIKNETASMKEVLKKINASTQNENSISKVLERGFNKKTDKKRKKKNNNKGKKKDKRK